MELKKLKLHSLLFLQLVLRELLMPTLIVFGLWPSHLMVLT